MKTVRLLILLSAFLIMISSVYTLMTNVGDRIAVYINIGAMFALVLAISVMNFKGKPKDHI